MAVTVTAVEALTAEVVAVKVAEVAPAATVTEAGSAAALELSLRVTAAPPVGAGPFSVTVPVELLPPTTVVGLKLNAEITGGTTVRVAVLLPCELLAVMVTAVDAPTAEVVMVKLALVEPAATVTEAGTVAALELSLSETVAPPVPAAAARVTVPVELVPPVTLVGLTDTEVIAGGGAGLTVNDAGRVTPP